MLKYPIEIYRAAYLGVCLDVLGQVVRAHELLGALRALEPLFPGVGAPVALQLVRPRELLAAERPAADERPLARVPPQVGPQVRRLAVHLAAARDMADVLALPRHVAVPALSGDYQGFLACFFIGALRFRNTYSRVRQSGVSWATFMKWA